MTVGQLIKVLQVSANQRMVEGSKQSALALQSFADALRPAEKLTVSKLVRKLAK